MLEALLACALLSLIIGSVIHHYGQWFCSYKRALRQGKALSLLMMVAEKGTQTCSEPEYAITKKNVAIDDCTGSLREIPTIEIPRPHCYEVTIAWQDERNTIQKIGAIMGAP